MITSLDQLDLSKRYTYADYLSWQFEDLVELIRGKVVKMPAPTTLHQTNSTNLLVAIGSYLKGKQCKAFAAPFDVRLPLPPEQATNDKVTTVVQPDICIVRDLEKLDKRGCKGAPDWIIEILSKSTASKDLKDKFELYQHAKVKEYWVVYPNEETIIPYQSDQDGKYIAFRPNPFTKGEQINSHVFPDLKIELSEIFE